MSNGIIFVGSVISSEIILRSLIENGLPPDKVFSLKDEYSANVSGYSDLSKIAREHGVDYVDFKNINDEEHVKVMEEMAPDYIFIVGLSQLVSPRIINAPRKGVIGFHPTALPKFRGRAAIPWQILLDVRESKSSLFYIDEGTDTGEIIDQETYLIGEDDYAEDVEAALNAALKRMVPRIVQKIKDDALTSRPQDEDAATYLLKRVPEDGRIDWNDSVRNIHKLIRATSKPYPGAFSHYKDKRVIFWRGEVHENNKYYGIPGQIIHSDEGSIDIFCKDGILRITDYETESEIRFIEGNKFI
ncbi:methionyl-tRNA formyltransferase [Salinicoccus halitifaciens]|uniref:Methionyl-tRNA formyltransferase n=1 Tax=Salinicoccus halitifaciens TaxID=1073415 RepID=A0ABV2E7T1_9STAP|nr:formyltransferase family protein [Salinicoccus halitifaciens]MCD2136462.1 methionyl-tRNA formyltransferase [Salinicoccus halitifaciens]